MVVVALGSGSTSGVAVGDLIGWQCTTSISLLQCRDGSDGEGKSHTEKERERERGLLGEMIRG